MPQRTLLTAGTSADSVSFHSTSLSSCSRGDGQVEVVAQRISISCGLGHCAVGLRGLTHAL